MEDEYDYNTLREVGRVSAEALDYSRKVVKEGARFLEIAEGIEEFIRSRGMELAFPVNISVDSNAAHYTPEPDDKAALSGSETVKIDLGARKGEYLGDCAITIDLSGENAKLVEAADQALENAISIVKAGRAVNEIGREIANTASSKGFNTIRNLGGHGISRLDLHADIFIPNFDNGDTTVLEEDQVIAIEPFLTDGEGFVIEGEHLQIFQKTKEATTRSNDLRPISDFISNNYMTYPFALRWLKKGPVNDEFRIRRALNELARQDAIEGFPVLVERKKGMVAQSEKEMIVQKEGCEIVTK